MPEVIDFGEVKFHEYLKAPKLKYLLKNEDLRKFKFKPTMYVYSARLKQDHNRCNELFGTKLFLNSTKVDLYKGITDNYDHRTDQHFNSTDTAFSKVSREIRSELVESLDSPTRMSRGHSHDKKNAEIFTSKTGSASARNGILTNAQFDTEILPEKTGKQKIYATFPQRLLAC